MNKRGQAEVSQTMIVFEILAAIVVATFFILSALTFNQHTKFNRVYLQEDAKLMHNVISSSPDYVRFNYTHSQSYQVKLLDQEAQVNSDLKLLGLKERVSMIYEKAGPLDPVTTQVYNG